MLLLNWSYPLTPEHIAQVKSMIGQKVERGIELPAQVDPQEVLVPQMKIPQDCFEWEPHASHSYGKMEAKQARGY